MVRYGKSVGVGGWHTLRGVLKLDKYEEIKRQKIRQVLREFKQGRLRSSSGQIVRDQRQALAIALSEAERLVNRMKKNKQRRNKR